MQDRIYLTEDICKTITDARIKKKLNKKQLSEIIGKNPCWMTRVERMYYTSIKKEEAVLLENTLNISLVHYNEAYYNEALVQKINELEEENRRLKELLIEKWKRGTKEK